MVERLLSTKPDQSQKEETVRLEAGAIPRVEVTAAEAGAGFVETIEVEAEEDINPQNPTHEVPLELTVN